MHSPMMTELAHLRRDELIAEATRARRIRVCRAGTTTRAWGWRRGRLVPVPRPLARLTRAHHAGVGHSGPRHRSNWSNPRVQARPADASDVAG
jgi:hypothetical protein